MPSKDNSVASCAQQILTQVKTVVVGKDPVLLWVLAAILARGHILLEDIPGVGKTTMALAFSKALGLETKRVQFTPDTMPSDIIGFSMPGKDGMVYQPGAIMTNLLLADEINRTSSKTQSALLEAMEEGQVTIEGATRPLPEPFFVIATQNPVSSGGTFALPESQLDRFLMRIELGYPDKAAERAMLLRSETPRVTPQLDKETLVQLQQQASAVSVSEPVLDYLLALVGETRQPGIVPNPLSPRAAQGLLAASKAWALLADRDYLLPDDIQAVFAPVAEHRLRSGQGQFGSQSSLSRALLERVDPLR